MGKGSEPTPPDWKSMGNSVANSATKQLENNRLNTRNPFGSQTFNDDGSTSTQLEGDLGSAAQGLMRQAGGMAQPMDWGQFGQVGNGDQARNQAIDAGFGQATSRLNPMWDRREEQARTRLLNQGLDPTSEAYKNSMGDLGMQRNDATNQAMFSAIGQGQSAGDSVFRNNLMSQQNSIANALRQRGQPMAELQQLQGLLSGQPQYNQDNTTMAGAMGRNNLGIQGYEAELAAAQRAAQGDADAAGGVMSGLGTAAGVAAMFF